MKKGDIMISKLGKIVLIVALMLVLLIVIYFMRDEMYEIWEKLFDFLRFGG